MSDLKVVTHSEMKRALDLHKRFLESGGTEGEQADLSGIFIEGFDFGASDLSAVIGARESNFANCRFVGCDLYGVSFSNSSAIAATFKDATLIKTEFYKADLTDASFDGASMVQAELIGTNLTRASFREARLRAAIISKCDLTEAVFERADVEHAAITDNNEHRTVWTGVKGKTELASV